MTVLTWYASLAQQQASLGWERQNHARPVQWFVGKSRRYLSEPCCGHHIACRLLQVIDHIIIPHLELCRLHSSLLELQVWHSLFYFHLGNHWPISRIWKECFVERGWRDYSFWPYDDLQRCSASHYQWFHFKTDGSRLGLGPDSPAAESQAWVWRVTCASLTISYAAYFFLRWPVCRHIWWRWYGSVGR